jgi:hypothetical protein
MFNDVLATRLTSVVFLWLNSVDLMTMTASKGLLLSYLVASQPDGSSSDVRVRKLFGFNKDGLAWLCWTEVLYQDKYVS